MTVKPCNCCRRMMQLENDCNKRLETMDWVFLFSFDMGLRD